MSTTIRKVTGKKLVSRTRRHNRIRKKVSGSAERPRLCVTRSNRTMVCQVIDDSKGVTLLHSATPKGKTANAKLATELGKELAQKAIAAGIKKVVFDRGGFIYHGRIAALAGGAREAGLEF
jgi:large subunit ribosomal protein L18